MAEPDDVAQSLSITFELAGRVAVWNVPLRSITAGSLLRSRRRGEPAVVFAGCGSRSCRRLGSGQDAARRWVAGSRRGPQPNLALWASTFVFSADSCKRLTCAFGLQLVRWRLRYGRLKAAYEVCVLLSRSNSRRCPSFCE